MCEEESDDAEAVAKLLEINDSIHRTIERYKLMKAGDVEAANKIAKGTLGTTTGVGTNAANELSLIDFDPEPAAAAAGPDTDTNGSLSLLDAGAPPSTTAPSKPHTVEDDLLGLSIGDSSAGPGTLGAISLGQNTTSGIPSGSIFSSSSSPPTNQQAVPQAAPRPNYDAFASLTSALPLSKPATPVPAVQQQRPTSQTHIDPFASLVSSSSRPATPARQANSPQPRMQLANTTTVAGAADDEWTFESSLPVSSIVKVLSSDVEIEFEPRRLAGTSDMQITARFSNSTHQRITGLHFQVAVEKSYSLQLKPQSGREMAPKARNAIQQEILLSGVAVGKGNVVKMRFKVSYEVNGQAQEQQGNVPSLGIS